MEPIGLRKSVELESKSLLAECGRIEVMDKGCVLIDARAYYNDLFFQLQQARKQILIIGWDFNTQVQLVRPKDHVKGFSTHLGAFLSQLAERRPDLEIYVLCWNFSMFFWLDREKFLSLKMAWTSHPRVHFKKDDRHPLFASHHQKIVVVDDQIAYCGGLDLAAQRWDTPAHSAEHPLRRDCNGKSYCPFHDVQVKVAGDAARALGDFARDRWFRATGQRLQSVQPIQPVTWTESRSVKCLGLPSSRVGLARTVPGYAGEPEVREVERLFVRLISEAREYLYIENQYLTSESVVAAVEHSLTDKQGPEVLILLPQYSRGWFEQRSMGATRNRAIRRLRQADQYGRLGMFYSFVPGRADGVKIHSKLLVSDDRYATIGSANLNRRSMGLDTECNLFLEAENAETRRQLRRLRDELLGEHLGLTARDVESYLQENPSLLQLVESRSGQGRHLRPVEAKDNGPLGDFLANIHFVDRDQPYFFERYGGKVLEALQGRFLVVLVMMIFLALVFIYTFGALGGESA